MSAAGAAPTQTTLEPAPAGISEIDWNDRIARGLVSGVVPAFMRGQRLSVGTAWEDVATNDVVLPAAPFTVEVLSSSANDTNASGTGARSVRVWGLSADGEATGSGDPLAPWQSESFALNGITPVAGSAQFLSIDALQVEVSGASLFNEGDITVRVSGGGADLKTIASEASESRLSQLSMPIGWQATVSCLRIFWTGADSMEFELRAVQGGTSSRQMFDGIVPPNTALVCDIGRLLRQRETAYFRARRTSGGPAETAQIYASAKVFRQD